jgi:gliding motility-associated-like protein
MYPDGQTHSADPVFSDVALADAGDYTLLATDQMGCISQKSIHLQVNPIPMAAFHGKDTMVVQSGFILHAGTGQAFYRWNTEETTENITITAEGMYTVDLVSWFGCTNTDSIYLLIPTEEIKEACLYAPNAFTPNKDGVNDIFMPISLCDEITYYRLYIFDRWGEMLFKSSELSDGWDGRIEGVLCPGDVYTFMITYKTDNMTQNDDVKVLAGAVVLVR